jgi:hypothetical protein
MTCYEPYVCSADYGLEYCEINYCYSECGSEVHTEQCTAHWYDLETQSKYDGSCHDL